MSIIRKRSAAHRCLLPKNTRDNQYIIAEFSLTDELIASFTNKQTNDTDSYKLLYQNLSSLFFKLCNKYDIKNSQFIANDKLPRVRFSQEIHQWQTNQQILFYYNAFDHEINKSFYDDEQKAQKISLLFLTNGLDIRLNSASFHNNIVKFLNNFIKEIKIKKEDIRIRDHQHITYDIFSKKKGYELTRPHQLRPIPLRYQQQYFPLPNSVSEMNYAVINIPITNHLLNLVDIDPTSNDPYNPLYTFIADAFAQAAKRYNLNNGALIANGLLPIVRFSENEEISTNGELQILGFNPALNQCGLLCKWNAKELVDHIQLIFVATAENCSDYGYAMFLNQIEKAIKLISAELEISPKKEEIITRFHQHIAYNL